VTGLRNPCGQLNGVAPGLMRAVLEHDEQGNVMRRKAGVCGIVVAGGEVRPATRFAWSCGEAAPGTRAGVSGMRSERI